MVKDAPGMMPPKQDILNQIPPEWMSTLKPYVEHEYEAMDSPTYHMFKDLVCGNVDKESVVDGRAECGFLVNGLSFTLMVICTIFKL